VRAFPCQAGDGSAGPASAGRLLAPASSADAGKAAAPGAKLDSTSPREIQTTSSPGDLLKALS